MNTFFVLTTILAVIGEGYCGYRLGGGGYAVQGIQQQAASIQEEKVSSSAVYGASESGYGGYGGSSVYGAASGASSAVYEQSQAASQSYAASGSSLDVASGYNALGARSASYGGYSAVRSQQQQTSYSSTSSSVQSVNYAEYWPSLYQDQFFRAICELDSFDRSVQITQNFLAQREVDYYSTFSTFYSQNTFLQKYIYACTGFITESDAERQIFFNKIVSKSPATIIRSLLLFAVHPQFFTSNLANFIITKTSAEIIQTAASSSWSFSYWQETISYLVRSRTYRSTLYNFFGCNDESALWSALAQSYETNRGGFFLFLKHVVTRRNLFARQQYFSLDFNTYQSQSNIWSRKLYKSQYYTQYQSYKSSISSSSYDSSVIGGSGYGVSSGYGVRQAASSTVSQSSQSIQQAGYGSSGIVTGGSGLSTGYSTSRVSQKTSTSTAIYESYYPELYKDTLFQSLCGFDSFAKSNEIYQRESSFLASYDYQKRFSTYYSNNAIFKNYFRTAIGLSFDEIESESFFSLVKSEPAYFLKTLHLYAKHPLIFKNKFTEFIFATSSAELIQTSESVVSSYFQESYFQTIAKSTTYRSIFASIFQCEESAVYQRLKWAYTRNYRGTILLLRHVLSRRTLFSLEDYLSINTKVWQTRRDYFTRRSYLKNTYYKRFVSSRSSSFSSSQTIKKSKRSLKRTSTGSKIAKSFGKRKGSDSSD